MDVWLVHHVLCLFTPQLLLVLIAPTPKGRPGCGSSLLAVAACIDNGFA